MGIDKQTVKLADIIEDAHEAFWAKVAEHMPLAESGDFDPMQSARWDDAMEAAVRHWWSWNASEHYDLDRSK